MKLKQNVPMRFVCEHEEYKAHSDKASFADLVFKHPELGPMQVMQLFGMRRRVKL